MSIIPPAASVVVIEGMADSVDLLPNTAPVAGPVSVLPPAGGVGSPRGWASVGTSWENRFVRVDAEGLLLLSAGGANQELAVADGDGVVDAGCGAGAEWVLWELCSRDRCVRR